MRSHLCLLALVACGTDAGPTGPVETLEVTIVDSAFEPASIIVRETDTVTWTWTGLQQHTVTFDDLSLPSSQLQTLGQHQVTFGVTGTFTYYCVAHGRSQMAGSVEVVVTGQDPEP